MSTRRIERHGMLGFCGWVSAGSDLDTLLARCAIPLLVFVFVMALHSHFLFGLVDTPLLLLSVCSILNLTRCILLLSFCLHGQHGYREYGLQVYGHGI
jgi:hypothetical protein